MKKTAKKSRRTVDRTTVRRTMPDVREIVDQQLKAIGKSRLWLAVEIGVRPATVYDFFNGKDTKVETLRRMMAVLSLELRPIAGFRSVAVSATPRRR